MLNRAVQGFDILWWFILAFLLCSALKSFLWNPIQHNAKREIPTVVIKFTNFFIYTLAFMGIIAFVFDQKLTSLLATSGVLNGPGALNPRAL